MEDLEKASESTNHENGMLRAQVERLQVELKEYRKRLSWVSNNMGARPQGNNTPRANTNPAGTSDFQFQFPKFGDSPTTSIFSATSANNTKRAVPQNPRITNRTSSVPSVSAPSPAITSSGRNSVSNPAAYMQVSRNNSTGNSPMNQMTASPPTYGQPSQQNNVDAFTGLFSPSILEATRNSPNNYFGMDSTQQATNTRGSFDNTYSSVPGLYSGSSVSNTESPGSLSDAQHQMSSIGTSPDPTFNSPHNKLQDVGLNTINEEGNLGQWNCKSNVVEAPSTNCWIVNTTGAPEFDTSGFSWLAQQNGGGFDPVLFGDYRETTDNLLGQDFGSFFNDAYPLPELGSPSHNYSDLTGLPQQTSTKSNDLISQVDSAKEAEVAKPADAPKLMTCNKIW